MCPAGVVGGFPRLGCEVGWRRRIPRLLRRHRVLALLHLALQIRVALGRVSTVREGLGSLLARRVLEELNDEGLFVVQHLVGVPPHLPLQPRLLCRTLPARHRCRRLLLRLGVLGVTLCPVLVPVAWKQGMYI